MKKLKQYFFLLHVFLGLGVISAHSVENDAVERFIVQYDVWKKNAHAFNSGFKPPWKPFMAHPFHEGLSLKQRKLYLELQESGDCQSVIQMDLIGFLTLYPVLIRAFERNQIRSSFEHAIVFWHSNGARRCDALNSARKASSSINNTHMQRTITLPLRKERLPTYSNKIISSRLDSLKQKQENAYMNIYYLAVCKSYIPAIRDLEEFAIEKKISLAPIDKTYLSIRSAELGMNGVPSSQIYKVFNRASSHTRIDSKIRGSIEMQLFGSIEINFQSYYAKWCEKHS